MEETTRIQMMITMVCWISTTPHHDPDAFLDTDEDGIDNQDIDIDGDGVINAEDEDIDGDGDPNTEDCALDARFHHAAEELQMASITTAAMLSTNRSSPCSTYPAIPMTMICVKTEPLLVLRTAWTSSVQASRWLTSSGVTASTMTAMATPMSWPTPNAPSLVDVSLASAIPSCEDSLHNGDETTWTAAVPFAPCRRKGCVVTATESGTCALSQADESAGRTTPTCLGPVSLECSTTCGAGLRTREVRCQRSDGVW